MWREILRKFVKFIDPRLEPYREKKVVPKYTPKSLEDFVGVVQRTPKSILNSKDRDRLAAIMSFNDRIVANLMVPKSKMVFVKSSELLGPLVLDELYRSGFTIFPVTGARSKIIGTIDTTALNALEVRNLEKAEKYANKNIFHLHATDTLEFAASEIVRTGSNYFLVYDDSEELVGFFTTEMLFHYLSL